MVPDCHSHLTLCQLPALLAKKHAARRRFHAWRLPAWPRQTLYSGWGSPEFPAPPEGRLSPQRGPAIPKGVSVGAVGELPQWQQWRGPGAGGHGALASIHCQCADQCGSQVLQRRGEAGNKQYGWSRDFKACSDLGAQLPPCTGSWAKPRSTHIGGHTI